MCCRNVLAAIAVIYTLSTLASAQQLPEYFVVKNTGRTPFWVTLRGIDAKGAQTAWQSYLKVLPGDTGRYRLTAYQPFDIFLAEQDGSGLLFERVNLCSYMQACKQTGRWKYSIVGRPVRVAKEVYYETHTGGRVAKTVTKFQTACANPDQGCSQEFTIKADATNIRLEDIQFPGTRPAPPPPKNGPKR